MKQLQNIARKALTIGLFVSLSFGATFTIQYPEALNPSNLSSPTNSITQEAPECSICLEELTENEPLIHLDCNDGKIGHSFHLHCIHDHVTHQKFDSLGNKISPLCPECRAELKLFDTRTDETKSLVGEKELMGLKRELTVDEKKQLEALLSNVDVTISSNTYAPTVQAPEPIVSAPQSAAAGTPKDSTAQPADAQSVAQEANPAPVILNAPAPAAAVTVKPLEQEPMPDQIELNAPAPQVIQIKPTEQQAQPAPIIATAPDQAPFSPIVPVQVKPAELQAQPAPVVATAPAQAPLVVSPVVSVQVKPAAQQTQPAPVVSPGLSPASRAALSAALTHANPAAHKPTARIPAARPTPLVVQPVPVPAPKIVITPKPVPVRAPQARPIIRVMHPVAAPAHAPILKAKPAAQKPMVQKKAVKPAIRKTVLTKKPVRAFVAKKIRPVPKKAKRAATIVVRRKAIARKPVRRPVRKVQALRQPTRARFKAV